MFTALVERLPSAFHIPSTFAQRQGRKDIYSNKNPYLSATSCLSPAIITVAMVDQCHEYFAHLHCNGLTEYHLTGNFVVRTEL